MVIIGGKTAWIAAKLCYLAQGDKQEAVTRSASCRIATIPLGPQPGIELAHSAIDLCFSRIGEGNADRDRFARFSVAACLSRQLGCQDIFDETKLAVDNRFLQGNRALFVPALKNREHRHRNFQNEVKYLRAIMSRSAARAITSRSGSVGSWLMSCKKLDQDRRSR